MNFLTVKTWVGVLSEHAIYGVKTVEIGYPVRGRKVTRIKYFIKRAFMMSE